MFQLRYFLPVLYFLSTACSAPEETVETLDRYAHIEDVKARAIIRRSIENAGGIERWEAIKRLRYTKNFDLLLESGEVEKSFKQIHDYQYDPLKIEIQSEEDGTLIQTIYENGEYRRMVNGEAIEVSQEALAKAVNTSTYVISMPFKLLDPGAAIAYEGLDTLEDNRVVEMIKVSYDATEFDNHSTSDTWRYYFDSDDGKIVANWVQSSDHANIIDNISFERAGDILFNKRRKSFRVDSLGNKTFVRADYEYGNYQIDFK